MNTSFNSIFGAHSASSIEEMLSSCLTGFERLKQVMTVAKEQNPELFPEDSTNGILLGDVSYFYIDTVGDVKNFFHQKQVETEFIRLMIWRDLLPTIYRVVHQFEKNSSISDAESSFLDMYMHNLKEQVSYLK